MSNVALIHDEECFLRLTLEERMSQYGVRNIARMELFLWDLEIFLQIQKVLKDRVVLKGGAAVQFYLPPVYQRTSVDIDMIFFGSSQEIKETLEEIEKRLGANEESFKFSLHIPRNPKTKLPLDTFHIMVPSVCSEKELYSENGNYQELKIEFIYSDVQPAINKVAGTHLFAVASHHKYNLLPLNYLFADKLTTLGPRTIGIQNDRMDEQIKQIFDIEALLTVKMEEMDFVEICEKYWERAEMESKSRGINFDHQMIIDDVWRQLDRLAQCDNGQDKELQKYINDFQSLYIQDEARKSPADWAIIGEKVKLLLSIVLIGKQGRETFFKALNLEEQLLFKKLLGIEKRNKIIIYRDKLIEKFKTVARIDPKIMKRKPLQRVFWAIVTAENIDEIINSLQE